MTARVYDPVDLWLRRTLSALPLLVTALGIPSARQAIAAQPPLLPLKTEVRGCKLMSIGAVRLPSVVGDEILTSKRVRLVAHRLKMGRIHTRAIAAEVVNLEAVRDLADESLKDEAVRQAISGPSIPLSVALAGPLPAVCRPSLGAVEIDPHHESIGHEEV